MGFLIIGGIRTQVGSSEREPGGAKREVSRQAHHVGADCISFATTFLLKSHLSLIPSLLLFQNRSRSHRLFACKRAHDGFGSLPTCFGYESLNPPTKNAKTSFSSRLAKGINTARKRSDGLFNYRWDSNPGGFKRTGTRKGEARGINALTAALAHCHLGRLISTSKA